MIDLATPGRHLLAGLALLLLGSAPALAATYQVGLFQGATGTGNGAFTFSNPGTVGSTPTSVSIATNASSTIGIQTFIAGNLDVQVAAVNFNDGKTPPNQLTGNFVEGLTGSLQTAPVIGLTGTGTCQTASCFYRITFVFAANVNPNTAGVKTYTIDRVVASGNTVDATVVSNGTYSVSDIATIPEPGSIALVVIGFAALAWGQSRRRRAYGRFAA